MATNWKVLTGDDLWKVVSRAVVKKVDEDVDGDTYTNNAIDTSLTTRAKECVRMAIQEIRANIQKGGRVGFSLTPDSVPPEAEWHALAIAAYRLCLPVPGLLAVVMNEGGVFSPLGKMHADALAWCKRTDDGGPVTPPSDPTGEDYETAVSDTNLAVQAIRWGDAGGTSRAGTAGQVDVTTDGPWQSSLAT